MNTNKKAIAKQLTFLDKLDKDYLIELRGEHRYEHLRRIEGARSECLFRLTKFISLEKGDKFFVVDDRGNVSEATIASVDDFIIFEIDYGDNENHPARYERHGDILKLRALFMLSEEVD